jgi:hypothetical protein
MTKIARIACRIVLAALFVLGGHWGRHQSRADEVIAPAESAAIRKVIEDQIAAFGRDDGQAAFSYASPTIQGIFGTPDQFMDMVRGGYQPVYRPSAVDFQPPEPISGGWDQPVIVVGPDGVTYMAIYQMQMQSDGSWKINGCRIERLPQQSV